MKGYRDDEECECEDESEDPEVTWGDRLAYINWRWGEPTDERTLHLLYMMRWFRKLEPSAAPFIKSLWPGHPVNPNRMEWGYRWGYRKPPEPEMYPDW